MPEADLQSLLDQMPRIADAVNAFNSEAVQLQAFTALVTAWSGVSRSSPVPPPPPSSKPQAEQQPDEITRPQKRRKRSETGTRRASPVAVAHELNLRPEGKQSFSDFVAEKQPRSNEDKYAVAVYWLEQVLGLDLITEDHIAAVFRLTREWKEPVNVRKGLQMTAQRKATIMANVNDLRTTPTGRNFVEHDLPPKSVKK